MKKYPYRIWAPEYDHTSAGIRALYELGKHLSSRGYDVVITQSNPANDDDIVIYPEIIPGNPLEGKVVVRYVLCFPGTIGGNIQYDPKEIVFTYSPLYYLNAPVLTVPTIEENIFYDYGLEREGGCFWVGKGFKHPRIPETEGMMEITREWPRTRAELALFLNHKKTFYTYDAFTALAVEAEKCGCEVVVIPGKVDDPSYDQQIKDFDSQLDAFISITQRAAFLAHMDDVAPSKPTPKSLKVSNFSLGIGIPCSFPHIPSSFFYSFVLMDKPSFTFIHADNGPIDTLRNDIVEKALSMGITHLLMCDVDQIYPVDTISKLLSHKLPIVGAKVHRRYPPFDPIMMRVVDNISYEPIDEYESGSLVEVDATGTGCIMYDTSIFRKLPYPWFKFQKNPENGMVIGEDIGLCQDLKEAGYRIYVDTSVEVGHLATMVINAATHNLYRAVKSAQAAKQALRVDASTPYEGTIQPERRPAGDY